MSEELDGTGGGFGRYRGVSLREFEATMDRCRREGGMRGASAVLRIAREQIDARGGLGTYPWLVGTCLVATAVLWFVPFDEGAVGEWRQKGVLGFLALGIIFGWITFGIRQERRKALYQESRIREASLQALRDIVSVPGFQKRSLDYTQKLTLQNLLKKTKSQDPVLLDLLRD
ncbi:MAG TPA: hypothetical protein VGE01_08110 [Fimbriimonas sp.]